MKAKGLVTQQEKSRGAEFTPRQKKFLTLLVEHDFKNPTALLKEAGYAQASWNHVYALRDDIRELAEGILIGHTPSAAMTLVQLVTSDTIIPQAGTKLAAAKEILDRVGITKEERVRHQVEHSGGIFIIPAKAPITINEDFIEGEVNE